MLILKSGQSTVTHKGVASLGPMAPCRSHHRNHTRQEWIIIVIRQELSPVTCKLDEKQIKIKLRFSNYGSATTAQQPRLSNHGSATTAQQPRLSNHGSATKLGSRFSNYASATTLQQPKLTFASATTAQQPKLTFASATTAQQPKSTLASATKPQQPKPTPSGKYMHSLILHIISKSHPLWQVHAQSHLTHHIKIPPPLASTCTVSSSTSYQHPTPSGKYMHSLILHIISKSHPLWQVHAHSHLTHHIKIPPPLASTCTVSSYTSYQNPIPPLASTCTVSSYT